MQWGVVSAFFELPSQQGVLVLGLRNWSRIMASSATSRATLASKEPEAEGDLKQQTGSRELHSMDRSEVTSISPKAVESPAASAAEPIWPNASRNPAILKPLSFPVAPKNDFSLFTDPSKDQPIYCFICDRMFYSSRDDELSRDGQNLERSKTSIERQSSDERIDMKQEGSFGREDKVREKKDVPNLGSKDEWLRHLLLEHRIVVHRVSDICSLKW